MQTILKLLLFTGAGFFLSACNSTGSAEQEPENIARYEKLDKADWLLGNWFNSGQDGEATETWEKANDSTFKAKSFVIAGTDTVFYESVSLEQRNNEVSYVVRVKDQQEEPVSFRLTSSTASPLVFENPQHNFPTKITYTKITEDSLYAEISGTVKGQERKEGFPFKKK